MSLANSEFWMLKEKVRIFYIPDVVPSIFSVFVTGAASVRRL